jgi:hypothetical protein
MMPSFRWKQPSNRRNPMSSPSSAAVATDGQPSGALADETGRPPLIAALDLTTEIRPLTGASLWTGLPVPAPGAGGRLTRDSEPADRLGAAFGEKARAPHLAVEPHVTVAADDERAVYRVSPRTPSAAAESADRSPGPLLPP